MASPEQEAKTVLQRLRKDQFTLWPIGPTDVGFIGPVKLITPEVRDLIYRHRLVMNRLLARERVALREIPPTDEEPHGWLLRRGRHPWPAMMACGSRAWIDACMIATAAMKGPERDLWVKVEHDSIVGDIARDDRDRLVATVKLSQDEEIGVFILDSCWSCAREGVTEL